MNVLEETIRLLEQQREKNKEELKTARRKRQEAKKQLAAADKAVDERLAADKKFEESIRDFRNGGQKKSSTAQKKDSNDKTQNNAQSVKNVNQQHVLAYCRHLVTKNPGMAVKALEQSVQRTLEQKTNLGLRGYSHRFKEVMKKDEFRVDEAGQVWLQGGGNEVDQAAVATNSDNPTLVVEISADSTKGG